MSEEETEGSFGCTTDHMSAAGGRGTGELMLWESAGSDKPAESEQSAVKIHFSILLGVSGQNKLSSLALLTCTTLLLPGPCPAPGAWAQRPHTAPAAKAQGQVRVGRQGCPQSCLGGPGHCCPLWPPVSMEPCFKDARPAVSTLSRRLSSLQPSGPGSGVPSSPVAQLPEVSQAHLSAASTHGCVIYSSVRPVVMDCWPEIRPRVLLCLAPGTLDHWEFSHQRPNWPHV